MAHIGRPPYTEAQIAAMTSKEEKLRAIAEYQRRGTSGAEPYRKPYDYSSGAKRGGHAYVGRGHGSYHPYYRPQPHFKNKSATFNKSDTESSDTNDTKTRPTSNKTSAANRQQHTEPATLCPALTSTGVCTRHACHYHHDPNKQALCKRWLYKDDCPKGEFCPLSHAAKPENAPTCLHFQDGRCNNDECRFAHVRVNPAALNCEAFGRLGYCEKGNTCTELHAHECPSFSNTGDCSYGDKCRLGHVHRASRMRKTTRPSSEASDRPEDDLDTAEDIQTWIPESKDPLTYKPQQFTQQADFVPLDAGD
ncbi:hypothetical protein T440DRAFT_507829 [Plenodomus tracheiphilus IPT5]|uniref:C3H1-type domain-containing protein n=1 Tax=Plenodomus tracheiphilus IPT5 TaxID=1408161 RepID=A0A6A7B644_9PLEO|nr:hypothetical protein T440DRAFT_507829 [Plenodomus tracheiphilus IPT5]